MSSLNPTEKAASLRIAPISRVSTSKVSSALMAPLPQLGHQMPNRTLREGAVRVWERCNKSESCNPLDKEGGV